MKDEKDVQASVQNDSNEAIKKQLDQAEFTIMKLKRELKDKTTVVNNDMSSIDDIVENKEEEIVKPVIENESNDLIKARELNETLTNLLKETLLKQETEKTINKSFAGNSSVESTDPSGYTSEEINHINGTVKQQYPTWDDKKIKDYISLRRVNR